MKKLFLCLCFTGLAWTSWSQSIAWKRLNGYNDSIVGQRLQYLNANAAAMDAFNRQQAFISSQNAALQARWAYEHPCWMLPAWRAATNQVYILQQLINRNAEEQRLLLGAGQGDSPRAKQLLMWLENENRARNKAELLQVKIEAEYRLGTYYRTNH